MTIDDTIDFIKLWLKDRYMDKAHREVLKQSLTALEKARSVRENIGQLKKAAAGKNIKIDVDDVISILEKNFNF